MAQIYRITTEMTGMPGGPYYNQTYWDDPSLINAQSAVASLQEFWDGMDSAISSQLTITVPGEVDVVESTTGQTVASEAVTGFTLPGGNANEALPLTTQLLLRLRTGVFVGGREIRGRMFIPGCTEENNTGGRPSAALVTLANNAASSLVNGIMAVYSPTRRVYEDVTSATAWNEWAVLRSRRD